MKVISLILLASLIFSCDTQTGEEPGPEETFIPYLYWSDSETPIRGVYRLRLDEESEPELVFTNAHEITGLVIDERRGHLYVADAEGRQILRASLHGGEREVAVGQLDYEPCELTFFEPLLYWSECSIPGEFPLFIEIWRMYALGTDIQYVFGTRSSVTSLFFDTSSARLYWSEAGDDIDTYGIRSVLLNGADPDTLLTFSDDREINDLVISSRERMVYWLEGLSSRIKRAHLDGTVASSYTPTNQNPGVSLALDEIAGEIYWSTNPSIIDDNDGIIYKTNEDGSERETVVYAGLGVPDHLTVVYLNISDNTLN